jgi:hypothetical protein
MLQLFGLLRAVCLRDSSDTQLRWDFSDKKQKFESGDLLS